MRRRVSSAVAAGALIVVAGSSLLAAPAAEAAGSFCGAAAAFPAAHRYVWTGAVDDSWQTAGNWDVGGAPASQPPGSPYDPGGPANLDDPTRDVDDVCIGEEPGGAAPTVVLGGEFIAGAAIAALDLGQGASLVVTGNSRLWLNGHRIATPLASNVRAGSTLSLQGATLGGSGTLAVNGALRAVTGVPNPDVPTLPFVVTITTRWCDVGGPCADAAAVPGRIEVGNGGVLVVDSDPTAADPVGINVEDSRQIVNAGTVKLVDLAYVAADHGVRFVNQANGTITIANSLGIYEGRDRYGLPLPVITNNGLVRKTGGGTSVLGASYQQGSTGTTRVDKGVLSATVTTTNTNVTVPAAKVAAGASYGLGACSAVGDAAQPCPSVTVDSTRPQAASARLSASSGGSAAVQITTQTTGRPSGAVGQVVQFETPGSTPTATDPNIFTLLYDASLVPANRVATIKIKRAPDGSTAFVTIPDCLADGTSPSGTSCVDRRGLAGSSGPFGAGAKIVIRTTANSRYVGV